MDFEGLPSSLVAIAALPSYTDQNGETPLIVSDFLG
jgi:hypothetical protein